MTVESIPHLSLGTAVLVIFLICVAFVALRGVGRMVVNLVVLAASAWAAFWVWQKAPALAAGQTGALAGWIAYGLPVLSFFLCFFLIRSLLKLITRPADGGDSGGGGSPHPFVRLMVRMTLALIGTAIICVIGITVIHHTGVLAELRQFSGKKGESKPSAAEKLVGQLKESVDALVPESWLRKLDPMAEPSRVSLAKAITARSKAPLKPVIDPATGKPIPRAIIVDDPELQKLAKQGRFGTLLRHPLVTKALQDPTVKAFIGNLDL